MDNPSLGKELFNLENKYWQAMRDKDIQTMLDLTDDLCIVTGAQGVASLEKKSLSRMLESSTFALRDFQLDPDYKVKILNEETAILAYKVHEDLVVDGKRISLDASDASTWIRRDGKWVCALHTESLSGDPFGRDRSKAI